MRIDFAADSLNERLGLALGKVPVPVGRSFFSMPAARAVGVAQRLGVFRELASAPATAEALAARIAARPDALRMLLDILAGDRLLRRREGRYALSRIGRRWLDPASATYVGTFVEHSLEFWDWWGRLEEVVRGDPQALQPNHAAPADDPGWPTYIRGQYELARLSGDDVARHMELRDGARSVLDVAGGHGWFAAALCRRHAGLRATVLDLPGSVAVGREIMRETGMDGVVAFVEGDMLSADLGGPHDAVLAFSILHHLQPEERLALLRRIRAALAPGGTLAVLDMFRPDGEERRVFSGAVFELFFHLTSAADVLSEPELRTQLAEAGFAPPRRHDVRTIPDYRLYTASAA
jgi:ubiquinone/menaquinone biosynthesis C-methylase UbiE